MKIIQNGKAYKWLLLVCVLLWTELPVYGQVTDYNTELQNCEKEGISPRTFPVDRFGGEEIMAVAAEDTVYITARETFLMARPTKEGEALCTLSFGTSLDRVAVCSNGWSKVRYLPQEVLPAKEPGVSAQIGYVPNEVLEEDQGSSGVIGEEELLADSEILDYPGKKDGVVIGTASGGQKIQVTGEMDGDWRQVVFTNEAGEEKTGYLPVSVLKQTETGEESFAGEEPLAGEEQLDGEEPLAGEESLAGEEPLAEEGQIPVSSGEGIFADAVEEIGKQQETEAAGVRIGTPVAASSDSELVPLGTFRITHYCPCSICCGPWADGITSTGVTAVTNHTIAVDPSVIPYGSQVVIGGQVYVAEDCGGAIKGNRIDIYVASHAEGENRGVYYTDVYLVQ